VDNWREARDVFVVEGAEVVSDWTHPGGRARNHQRSVRLIGDWTPGSSAGPGAQVVYAVPAPPGVKGPAAALHGAGACGGLKEDADDPRIVHLVEGRKPAETFADLPVALAPSMPLQTKGQEAALHTLGATAITSVDLPYGAGFDLLARRTPRLRDGDPLPRTASRIDDIVGSLTSMDDSYIAVQGPPGTGKTWTGARVIKRLVEQHGWRIGVLAQSHNAVENLLAGIVSAGLDPARVGKSKNKSTEPTWSLLTDTADARAAFLETGTSGGCVLGGTSWTFASARLVEQGGLDLLVVDEAGQFALAPTLAASVVARRMLLLGDPQQLPQVSQGSHPEPVHESALGWLMGSHDTLPDELGYFLADSYRMHPTLCAAVSRLSYDGRLIAAAPASARHLEGTEPGVEVVIVDHTGNSIQSVEEAEEVVRQVQANLGRRWVDPDSTPTERVLNEQDVLVVAPYNAQVQLIRARLAAAGLGAVRVGTVDRFQGQEAPVVVASMTASCRDEVPRGMDFLLNRNRINVAVSRAQWRAVILRTRDLTAFLPTTINGLLELGSFLAVGDSESHHPIDGRPPHSIDQRARTNDSE